MPDTPAFGARPDAAPTTPPPHPAPSPKAVAHAQASAAPNTTTPARPAGKPDAILCPANYPPPKGNIDRHVRLKEEFAPVLGSTLIYSRHSDVGRRQTFITAEPNDSAGRGVSRYFGPHHVRAGQERYDWKDRGDGVLYGTLKAEAIEDEKDARV